MSLIKRNPKQALVKHHVPLCMWWNTCTHSPAWSSQSPWRASQLYFISSKTEGHYGTRWANHTLVWHSVPSTSTTLLQSHLQHFLQFTRGRAPHAIVPFLPRSLCGHKCLLSFRLSLQLCCQRASLACRKSPQGRHANCWGRQDEGDSTNFTYTPTRRLAVTAIKVLLEREATYFTTKKRKRPGSLSILGRRVFNGRKDLYKVQSLPSILKPGYLERPYPNHSSYFVFSFRID